ncbi:MAG TPA: hypothetical protein VET27_10075 [Mycobacterium sp.]|nr:hypothetical protein [Mycobacterium sp.]
MGDTLRDPIDHYRTTLPHAGATLKDSLMLPGVMLLVLSVTGLALGVASAGYMRPQWAALIALAAAGVGAVGVVLLAVERRRVQRIDSQWQHDELRRSTTSRAR